MSSLQEWVLLFWACITIYLLIFLSAFELQSQILFLQTFHRTCVVLKILQGLFVISDSSWKEISLSDRSPQTHGAPWLQGLLIALQRRRKKNEPFFALSLSLSSFLPPRQLHIKTISSKKHKTLFKVPFHPPANLFFSQCVDFLLIWNSMVGKKTKEKKQWLVKYMKKSSVTEWGSTF